MADPDGQPTDAPPALGAQPAGRDATPPSRDPDDPDAPGAGAAERTDENETHVSEPDPPAGLAGP